MVVRFYRVISSMVTPVMKRRLITGPAVSLDSGEIPPVTHGDIAEEFTSKSRHHQKHTLSLTWALLRPNIPAERFIRERRFSVGN